MRLPLRLPRLPRPDPVDVLGLASVGFIATGIGLMHLPSALIFVGGACGGLALYGAGFRLPRLPPRRRG